MIYTQGEIREMFAIFQGTGRYEDRIKMYDQYFNILPFTLPAFDINLFNFFSDKNLDQFEAILHQERRLNISLNRSFEYEQEEFSFNIKPMNSNYLPLNTYLVQRFLQIRAYVFSQIQMGKDQPSADQLLATAKEMIGGLERQLTLNLRKNAITQYARVFFKGLTDFNTSKTLSTTTKRKKIIELYMYAMGFLYGEYISVLQFHQTKPEVETLPVGIEEKLLLLQEFGFIEAIKNRFPFLNKRDMDRKIADILYRVTGEKITSLFNITKH